MARGDEERGRGRVDRAVAPGRACAHRVLRRVFEGGAYAEKALQTEAAGLDQRDRALAMRLALGAIQRAGTSDHLIGLLAGRPARRMDPQVLASLRLGLYELCYLQGAPDYAVVADAVELAKAPGRRGHSLVNAVLRRAIREGPEQLLGGLDDATPAGAAVKHSHPEWVAKLWWQALGAEQARALMAADNESAEVALRVNTLLADPRELAGKLPVPVHGDPRIPEALVLEGPLDLHASPLWREGAVTAQSRGAMLVARSLDPRPGERVLDLCAAPGNKTTHIAALMEGEGQLVAVEANSRRARTLRETAARMRAGNVEVVHGDAREPLEAGLFDRVLVDPPCSGLGTLQARADLRWRVKPESVEELRLDQFRILDCAARALRPGGVLVYSTCTISPIENERLIVDFLDSHPDFAVDDLTVQRPELAPIAATPGLTGAIATFPHRDGTAGFFVARLARR